MNCIKTLPIAILASAMMLCAPIGCSQEADPLNIDAGAAAHDPGTVRTDVYEGVRGEITSMPVENDHSSALKIHHEHIPVFRAKGGEINVNSAGIPGMRAMTMEFPLAEGVSLDGFAVGDKVAFTFAVNWGGMRAWEVTAIEKIPQDTELDFSDKPLPEGVSIPAPKDEHDDHAGHDHGDHAGHDHGP